jgi:hypothetical protein
MFSTCARRVLCSSQAELCLCRVCSLPLPEHAVPCCPSPRCVCHTVLSRCVEVLLLQRQHREAMKAKHTALLQEYHTQQQQQEQQQQQTPLTLLTAPELSEVKVWDAFFDATLQVGVLPFGVCVSIEGVCQHRGYVCGMCARVQRYPPECCVSHNCVGPSELDGGWPSFQHCRWGC